MFSLLYVDDEPELLEIGRLFLETSGEFEVSTVESGDGALAHLERMDFDAIVSDYQMPGMNGIELLKAVRKADTDIPFILFTGRGREEVVIEAINNGADFYLQKGGDPRAQFAELSHKLRQAISRKRTEKALWDSEKRLSDIIDFLPDATFAIDTNGQVIAWNRAIEEMTGIPASNILGKGDYEYAIPFYGSRRPILIDLIFEPDDTVMKYYSGIKRESNSISAETNLPHPKGRRIDVMAKVSRLCNRDGDVIGAIESIRDITDLKKSEEELRALNEQLAASGEELRSQFDELAVNENRIRVSEARLRYMLGFYERARGRRQELMSYAVEGAGVVTDSPLGYLAFLNEDESELTMYAWSRSAMKECALREKPIIYKTEKTGLWGEPVRQRRPVITNNYSASSPLKKGYPAGHPQIVRHMSVPVIENGRVVLVGGVANKASDYTDIDVQELLLLMQGLWQVLRQKETEAGLIENEARFRSIFENSPYPIVINDRRTHKYIDVNEAFLQECGYTKDEVLGKDSLELGLLSPEDQERLVNLLRAGIRVEREAVTRIAKNGNKYHILISSLPVMLHNEPAILTMTADVSELERTREELRVRYDELVTAQNELRIRKQQMEEIASTIPGVVYQNYLRSNGEIGFYYVNLKSGQKIFGTDETITDFLEWFTSHVHPEDRARFLDSIETATIARKPWNFEGRFVKPSGDEIWFSGSSCPVEHKTELVFTGVLVDITERKLKDSRLQAAYEQISIAEEELREQYDSLAKSTDAIHEREEKYRLLVEVTGTGYVILDDKGKVIDANPEYVRLTGRASLPEILGRSVLEWTPENERTKNAAAVRQCLQEGSIRDFEINYMDRTGQVIPVEINAAVVHEEGKVRIITLTRDISGRKATEKALRRSEGQYRMLVENSHDIIFTLDKEGIFSFVSPSAKALLGYSPSDLTGKSFRSIVHPDDVATCETYLKNAIHDGPQRTDVEYRVFHADGSIRIQVANISQVFDNDGSILFVVGTARDITDMKRSQVAIRETSRKLNLLNSITRHDVANQLTTLLGYTQLAMMKKPDPVIADFIAKIESSAQVIRRQIEFTRAYQELGEGAPAWQALCDLVLAAEPRNVGVTCTCTSFEIYADPMLSKVFFNLFDNAVRHGEHVTAISVRCGTVGEDLIVFVEDNGVGIPLTEKSKLFQKGYGRNTGFGLFLTREILAITSISISETGTYGRGARFEITIPKGTYRSVP
ncbi:PAS domain S-box protein [Methanoregula sp.]|uniref:PAS domain S-box protein n=1 Tax=Methanoregula sp. TaxID=2052170 RepID=UPI003568A277